MKVKQSKIRVTYEENYKKNVTISPKVLTDLIDEFPGKISTEILAKGTMSDGKEFITIKIIIAP